MVITIQGDSAETETLTKKFHDHWDELIQAADHAARLGPSATNDESELHDFVMHYGRKKRGPLSFIPKRRTSFTAALKKEDYALWALAAALNLVAFGILMLAFYA